MKSWTIGRRVTLGFSATILVFVVVSLLSYRSAERISEKTNDVATDCVPGIYLATAIKGEATNGFARIAEHVLTPDPATMASVDLKLKDVAKSIDELYRQYEPLASDEKSSALLQSAVKARTAYYAIRNEVVLPLSREGKKKEAYEAFQTQLRPAFDKYFDVLGDLVRYDKDSAERGAAESENTANELKSSLLVGMGCGVCVAVLVATVIRIGISRVLASASGVLDSSSDQVASASLQVSSSSQTLAEGASEQAASLEETSASLEEMASMTRRNAENAQSAKELANQARMAADAGASDMAQMDRAMSEIQQASDNIARIIKTIDEIAFQTNILALNAAVEAARAGEAGMGFAVVADEVRNLAQRSAQAAKETAEKIEDCMRKSEAGVAISSKVGASLQEIQSKAGQVDELVAEIATASREQSQGIDQVNTALTQMDKVTQNNAASAEESASAAEELNAQAQALKEAVGELQMLVDGSRAAEHSTVIGKGRNAVGLSSTYVSSPMPTPSRLTACTADGIHGVNGAIHHRANGNDRKLQMGATRQRVPNRNVIPSENSFQDF